MSELFLKIVNMGISAGWLVLVVLVLRPVLKKAPKWVNVLLWALVGVRLVFPFSPESVLSLIPSAETVSPEIMLDPSPTIHSGIPYLNSTVNPVISETFAPNAAASANPLQIWIPVLSVIWLAGIAVLLLYTLFSYIRLCRQVSTAVLLRDNIFQSEAVDSPFVLGLIKPKIYLPFRLSGDAEHVISHEQAHIRRRDHWWKPLGFLLLAIYWFNPLMWVAYILLCRDIELACDEKVIKELGTEQRADYSQALLQCSVSRRSIAACPLAFGEVGVKARIKSVLNYKKPAFWIIVVALVACAVVAVCFLTNPETPRTFSKTGDNISDLDPQQIISEIIRIDDLDESTALYTNEDGFQLHLTADFNWRDHEVVQFFYTEDQRVYSSQLHFSVGGENYFLTERTDWTQREPYYYLQHYLEALKYLPQEEITALSPDMDQYIVQLRTEGTPEDYDRVITYTSDGAQNIDGWFIHLELQPMTQIDDSSYHGKGTDVIHVFYGQNKRPLTLNDVIELSEKGQDLTWADFERFNYIETGSGLYIRVYEIDEMFSLMIGGTFPDEDPWYIYLTANDGEDHNIDIREGGVADYIAYHQKNYVVIRSTDTWHSCPVGYNEDAFAKMVQQGFISEKAIMSSIQYFPVVRIDSKQELDEFIAEMKPYMNFDHSYANAPSFSAGIDYYNDDFFRGCSLILVYTTQPNSGNRVGVEYLRRKGERMYIGLMESEMEESDDAMESWLTCIEVLRDQLSGITKYDASIVSTHYPGKQLPSGVPLRTYVFNDSPQPYGKATVSLYDSGEFIFNFSMISSYFGYGTYEFKDDLLILKTKDGEFTYTFEVKKDVLVFDTETSSEMTWFSGLYDGAEMELVDRARAVKTLNGDLATYYELSDGTWSCDGITYANRLEIKGRLNNAACDTVYVYLSNVPISFEQAWKASGLSSNLADYFPKEKAVLVDMWTE